MSERASTPAVHADERWDRKAWLAFAALALTFVASSFWLVHPWYEANVETNDASMYILSAQALLRGEGYAYLDRAMIIRPPGMSLAIAPLLAWRGLDFAALNWIANAGGIAGALLVFAWLRPRTGVWVAAAASLCAWFNPGWRHFSNQVMSDVPGAALFVASFLVERWAARAPGWKRDAVLGAFVGASTYMRSVLVFVLPAIVAARVIEHWRHGGAPKHWIRFARDRAAVLVLAGAAAMAPWSVRNALVAPPPPADQNFIYSYGTGMLHANPRDPSSPPRPWRAVVDKVPERAAAITNALGERLEGREAPIPAWILGAWVLASVAYVLVRRGESAPIAFVLVAALLLVYFGFRARLVLPLYVIGLAAWIDAHLDLLTRLAGVRLARAIVATALLAVTALDFQPRKGWSEIEADHARRTEQARAWNEALGGAQRLASNIGWHHSVYVGKPVWSFFWAPRPANAPDGEGAKAAYVIERYDIDAVVLSDDAADRAWIPWLERRYGPGVRAGAGSVHLLKR